MMMLEADYTSGLINFEEHDPDEEGKDEWYP